MIKGHIKGGKGTARMLELLCLGWTANRRRRTRWPVPMWISALRSTKRSFDATQVDQTFIGSQAPTASTRENHAREHAHINDNLKNEEGYRIWTEPSRRINGADGRPGETCIRIYIVDTF